MQLDRRAQIGRVLDCDEEDLDAAGFPQVVVGKTENGVSNSAARSGIWRVVI